MRWLVGILAVTTIVLSANMLYLSYMVGMPDLNELGIPPEDAPDIRAITACVIAKELVAILTAGAALLYAFVRKPQST